VSAETDAEGITGNSGISVSGVSGGRKPPGGTGNRQKSIMKNAVRSADAQASNSPEIRIICRAQVMKNIPK